MLTRTWDGSGTLQRPRPQGLHGRRTSDILWSLAMVTPIIAGFFVRLPGLDRPLSEFHSFRQTQTAFTVREYMRTGIDLRHTPMPVLGPPWDVPMEFPLFQGIAALIGRVGLDPGVAARLTGLFFFEVTCALMGILALQWFSRATAVIAVFLFQLTPFAAQWAWASLIEFLATAAAIGATVTMNVWLKRRSALLLAVVSALLVVAFLVKPTTAAPWLVTFFIPAGLAVRRATSRRELCATLASVALPPVVGLAAAVAWTWHADRIKAADLYSRFLTSDRLHTWNFGTLDERGDVESWSAIINRLPTIAGSAGVFAVAVVIALVSWRRSLHALALALVPAVSVATFFNLYVVHDYYLCAIYPAVILIVAAALSGLVQAMPERAGLTLAGIAALAMLGAGWLSPQGQRYETNVRSLPVVPTLSHELSEATPRFAAIIVVGCDWDPTLLYYADRRGLMLRAGDGDADIAHHFADPSDPRLPQLSDNLVPQTLSYLASCGERAVRLTFLPAGVTLEPVSPHVWRLIRRDDG